MKKDYSIIVVIENCGKCPMCERASGGNKPVCVHPGIRTKRPYGTDRRIVYGEIPTWCPFKGEPT